MLVGAAAGQGLLRGVGFGGRTNEHVAVANEQRPPPVGRGRAVIGAAASAACAGTSSSTRAAPSAAALRSRDLRPGLFGAGVVSQGARPYGAVIVCEPDAVLIFE